MTESLDIVKSIAGHLRLIICALVIVGPTVMASQAQIAARRSDEVQAMSIADLRRQLEAEPENLAIIMQLFARASGEAMPELKAAFNAVHTLPQRQWLAAALIRSGSRDPEPFEFLVERVEPLLDSGMPSPVVYGGDGRVAEGEINAEFAAWCRQREIEPKRCAYERLYAMQPDLLFLEYTGDRRAIPVLEQALLSNNPVTVVNAAHGLFSLLGEEAFESIDRRIAKAPLGLACSVLSALGAKNASTLARRYTECATNSKER